MESNVTPIRFGLDQEKVRERYKRFLYFYGCIILTFFWCLIFDLAVACVEEDKKELTKEINGSLHCHYCGEHITAGYIVRSQISKFDLIVFNRSTLNWGYPARSATQE